MSLAGKYCQHRIDLPIAPEEHIDFVPPERAKPWVGCIDHEKLTPSSLRSLPLAQSTTLRAATFMGGNSRSGGGVRTTTSCFKSLVRRCLIFTKELIWA